MTVTVFGPLVTADGHARQNYWHQPEPERVGPLAYRQRPAELRGRHFAIRALEVRAVQRSWIGVNLRHDHDRTIGCVAHLELARDGSLWAVAEVHGAVPEGPVYFSPEWSERRDGRDVLLDGAAITPSPAQILLEPLTVLDGELGEHRHWRLPERHAAMVERAAKAKRGRRGWDDPLVVFDADPDRAERRAHASAMSMRRGVGPIERSAHHGRILNVR